MNKYVINLEKRLKLGNLIKNIRENNNLGMNQLATKINVTTSLIHRIENGQTQKISPFLLQEISRGLRIDYKELYKIVGYLEEKDFFNEKFLVRDKNNKMYVDEFFEMISNLKKMDLIFMLSAYYKKEIVESIHNGSYNNKKEEFCKIKEIIEKNQKEI